MTVVDLFAGLGGWDHAARDLGLDPLGIELGACGATGRHPSYGWRVCILPAGHQPPPGQPPTSTAGWHRSADGIGWATPEALARRAAALESSA